MTDDGRTWIICKRTVHSDDDGTYPAGSWISVPSVMAAERGSAHGGDEEGRDQEAEARWPSQWPGTARSAASAGRSLIMTMSLIRLAFSGGWRAALCPARQDQGVVVACRRLGDQPIYAEGDRWVNVPVHGLDLPLA